MTQNDIKPSCCQPFNKEPWDGKTLIWDNKPFLKDSVRQIFHIPIGYGKVITRMWDKAKAAGAELKMEDYFMLAYDPSPWKSELYMSVTKDVPNGEMVKFSGTFLTKVYDGPYNSVPKFMADMEQYALSQGKKIKKQYHYFTTCPSCAKRYGHNYIVGVAEVE